jgi:hypothetical protein
MQSVLNEDTIFDTVNTLLKKVDNSKVLEDRRKNSNRYLGGSIASYTKNLTMTFPVLVDDILSIETAQMISKANEKNIASMLELLFASMSFNQTKDKNDTGRDVLASIHRNVDMGMDDYLDTMHNYVSQNEEYLPKVSDAEVRMIAKEMCTVLQTPAKRFPTESLNENSLNEYMCRDTYNGVRVFKSDILNEAKRDRSRTRQVDILDNTKIKNDNRNNLYSIQKNDNSLNAKRIIDSDFKKANELQPTMMIVNFNVLDPIDGKTVTDRKSFVAGVKCRMIATTSLDIMQRLISSNNSKLDFKNLIRATSGEIKFGKDFIFAIDQQKLDAINDAKTGKAASLWSTLKKRSLKNNVRKINRDKNDATSITTLVVSMDTVNAMKNEAKFDLETTKNAKMIMDKYNLLCLVIADEVNEVARFMYDGNNEFESISYLVLSREAKDKSIRQATDYLIRNGGR